MELTLTAGSRPSHLSYLKATDLCLAFHAEPLFDGVTLTVNAGGRVALVGPNGVGKSTLLKVLTGQTPATDGRVELGPRTRLGYFAQQVPDPDSTVISFLHSALAETFALEFRLHALETRMSSGEGCALDEYGNLLERFEALDGWTAQARVDDVRHRLDVAHLADDARLTQVSGGEQARLMLARVLLAEPDILLLDEPTNHLDFDSLEVIERALTSFTGTVVAISHDSYFAEEVGFKTHWHVENGQLQPA